MTPPQHDTWHWGKAESQGQQILTDTVTVTVLSKTLSFF